MAQVDERKSERIFDSSVHRMMVLLGEAADEVVRLMAVQPPHECPNYVDKMEKIDTALRLTLVAVNALENFPRCRKRHFPYERFRCLVSRTRDACSENLPVGTECDCRKLYSENVYCYSPLYKNPVLATPQLGNMNPDWDVIKTAVAANNFASIQNHAAYGEYSGPDVDLVKIRAYISTCIQILTSTEEVSRGMDENVVGQYRHWIYVSPFRPNTLCKCHPFHVLAVREEPIPDWMLKRSYDVNYPDDRGRTPLMYAVLAGNLAKVQELMSMGAWANKSDSNSCSPLHVAIMHGDTRLLKILLATKPPCLVWSDQMASPCYLAYASKDITIQYMVLETYCPEN